MLNTVMMLASAGGAIFFIVYLAVVVIFIAGGWKMYAKAGKPGWGIIIPFYNIYLLCKIAGRPGWWLILFLIPVVNLIVWIIVALDLAKSFGKGTGFGVLTIFFGGIMFCVLGFGDATYMGAGGNKAAMTA